MRFVCCFNFISFKYLFLPDITNFGKAVNSVIKRMFIVDGLQMPE